MKQFSTNQIVPDRWPRLTNVDGIPNAWRHAHFAAQVAAELGKGWAEARADDGHSSLTWVETDEGRCLRGVRTARGERGGRHPDGLDALLKVEGMQVLIESPDGRTVADLTLDGRTVPEALAWLHQRAERELGPARQDPKPAPDLPEHPLNWLTGGTGRFFSDQAALNDLADLYSMTDDLLRRVVVAAGAGDDGIGSGAVDGGPLPVCWPHHFDHAVLLPAAVGGDGGAIKTIGIGLTPPDGLESAGYWYVSPWSASEEAASGLWPELPAGRWLGRGGQEVDDGRLRMAVLPLSEVQAAAEEARAGVLADFIANAFAWSLKALRGV